MPESLPDQGAARDWAEAAETLPMFLHHQRARLILEFTERGEIEHCAQTGWAKLDGPWVHWLDDELGEWQSWPMTNVVCVDWLRSAASDEQEATG